jgi:alpha-glucosidase
MKTLWTLILALAGSASSWGLTENDQCIAVGNMPRLTRISGGVELTAGRKKVRVVALTDAIIRVRVAPQGVFPDEMSWAVSFSADQHPSQVGVEENSSSIDITVPKGRVQIEKNSLQLIFRDPTGRVVNEDDPVCAMAFHGNAFRVIKKMPEDEAYSGLGDKSSLNLRDRAFTMWNSDSYGWQEATDPLYKSIPFFMGLRNGQAYGIFLDNTWRTYFDFGKRSRDIYEFGADGGELDYYFLFGPDPKDVLREYVTLTGKPFFPPLWAFGYQQSRYSYSPESTVRELAKTFREKKIPADVIYLDIDYQDHYRPFTVDIERFPHFADMVRDLKREGFKIVAITDPHIARVPGYRPYDEGLAADNFVKKSDGAVYVGEVWPGSSVFPDFTRSSVRRWWGTLYQDMKQMGVDGFWDDMNEPSIFNSATKTMPLSVLHGLDNGRVLSHSAAHNIYGMQNSRATYDGLLRLSSNERPFVLTRATYAGGQRYAASWTGDNSSTWNHMRLSVPMLLNLGISGFPFVGADIGGFVGSPSADLLTRWTALGSFYPLFRNHTDKGTVAQEPWANGIEHEQWRKKFINNRYVMLPYIYAVAEEAARTGIPMMRPLFLEFPGDKEVAGNQDEFMFGPTWFDYWTGEKLAPNTDGPSSPNVNPTLAELPVYVRAGAIIPRQSVLQSTNDLPQGPLELRIYPGSNCRGRLYLDDGHTFNYTRGEFLRQTFTCSLTDHSVTVELLRAEGTFTPWFTEVHFTIYGINSVPRLVHMDGIRVTAFEYDEQHHMLSLTGVYRLLGNELEVQY